MLLANKPAFDKSHWVPGVASIRMRTQADLEKAGQGSALIFRNQPSNRESGWSPRRLPCFELGEVLLVSCVGPEQSAQAGKVLPVLRISKPDLAHDSSPTPTRWRAFRCPPAKV
jgi:hypothetical protein